MTLRSAQSNLRGELSFLKVCSPSWVFMSIMATIIVPPLLNWIAQPPAHGLRLPKSCT